MKIIFFVTLLYIFSIIACAPKSVENKTDTTFEVTSAETIEKTEAKQTTDKTERQNEETKTWQSMQPKLATMNLVPTSLPSTVSSKKPTVLNTTNTLQQMFKYISVPITKVLEIPKINTVIKNIGTCIVNGVMEIVTFYVPAPVLPLIASAAGMMIPFEPIITLRRKMPVTSYRRAFKSAVSGFLNTFDRFKQDEDPYMVKAFRRRYGDDSKE